MHALICNGDTASGLSANEKAWYAHMDESNGSQSIEQHEDAVGTAEWLVRHIYSAVPSWAYVCCAGPMP